MANLNTLSTMNFMKQPNVVLVITDDQGYGDLGCTGNPWLKTPHIDHLYGESVRLTDFRAAIMYAHPRRQ